MSDYNDIINLHHHVSKVHPRMSTYNRAAQFAPFAALTGYDKKVSETSRLTDNKIELDEDMSAKIDTCLQILYDNAFESPEISVTYFIKDKNKSGGKYVTSVGKFKRIDESDCALVFQNGTKIPICDIYTIEEDIIEKSIN